LATGWWYSDATSSNSNDSTLHCFDLQRRRWSSPTAVAEQPRARWGHAAIPCGSGVFIFGGRGWCGEFLNDTFLLRVWT